MGRELSTEPSKPLFGEGAFYPIVLGLPALLLVIGGIWAFRQRPQMMASLERGEAEGRTFASTKQTPSACFDGALRAMDTYEEPREPGAAAFLESCLSVSGLPKTTGTKHSAPSRGQLERWARDECTARGREGDKHCALLIQLANLDPCTEPFTGGQTKAALPWACQR